jgi:hypothetical protein
MQNLSSRPTPVTREEWQAILLDLNQGLGEMNRAVLAIRVAIEHLSGFAPPATDNDRATELLDFNQHAPIRSHDEVDRGNSTEPLGDGIQASPDQEPPGVDPSGTQSSDQTWAEVKPGGLNWPGAAPQTWQLGPISTQSDSTNPGSWPTTGFKTRAPANTSSATSEPPLDLIGEKLAAAEKSAAALSAGNHPPGPGLPEAEETEHQQPTMAAATDDLATSETPGTNVEARTPSIESTQDSVGKAISVEAPAEMIGDGPIDIHEQVRREVEAARAELAAGKIGP